MGGGGSKKKKQAPSPAPAPAKGGYAGRAPPSAEEIERRRRDEEESKKWEEEARRVGPPPPYPTKPVFVAGGSEDVYKAYMRQKYEYELWENSIILLGRKLRQQAGG
eukprot:TRINITY_DN5841_c1_g1_i1.p1 TRINITY_DN5841_c1_g1~~TRINITY_DN5841_c1_g1_i1.p1  ORF type:complete len:107 (-),score=30.09 TRINITY_DN5841_c1_g1_i1:104-424(-)